MSSFKSEMEATALPGLAVGTLAGLILQTGLFLTGIGAIYLLKYRRWRTTLFVLSAAIVCIATLQYMTGKIDSESLVTCIFATFGFIFLPVLLAAYHYRRKEKEQAQVSEAVARKDYQAVRDPRMRRLLEAADRFDQMIDREAEKHRKRKAQQV